MHLTEYFEGANKARHETGTRYEKDEWVWVEKGRRFTFYGRLIPL